MQFSNINRSAFTSTLHNEHFDLLVIGGGITGCGIALDAALRGMKVALIEKNDFASGTSSRSTKLIHGGLRYLKQLEIKLVHDVGSERAIVHRLARHVVVPEKMLLPIVEGGSLGKFTTSLGLLVYDLLAGVKKEERRKMLNKHETLKEEPLLGSEKLLGGGLYFEYRTDDSRLVIEMAKSAFANGATLLNYIEAEDFIYENNQVKGVKAKDLMAGNKIIIKANHVVNAAGPWVDLLRKTNQSLKGKRLQLTKGVHLVFPYHKFPLKQAAYFDVADGRMIFAIPRNNITYVGTTDTVYNQSIDSPRCNRSDVDYLLQAINAMFPTVRLNVDDIESTWAGLRPLIHEDGKSASELSRKDEVMISETGLISIAGGKLTGYRLMAEKIVDLVGKKSGKQWRKCKTKNFSISGGEFKDEAEFQQSRKNFLDQATDYEIDSSIIEQWFYRYGKNTVDLLAIHKSLKEKGHNHTEELAEVQYCVTHEMAVHPNDYFIRRTGKIFFEKPAAEQHLNTVTQCLANQFNWSETVHQQYLSEVKNEFEAVTHFV